MYSSGSSPSKAKTVSSAVMGTILSGSLLLSPVGAGAQGTSKAWNYTLTNDKAYEFLGELDSEFLGKINYGKIRGEGRTKITNVKDAVNYLLGAPDIEVNVSHKPAKGDFFPADLIKIIVNEIVNDKKNRKVMINFVDGGEHGKVDGIGDFVGFREEYGETSWGNSKKYGKGILEPADNYLKNSVRKHLLPRTTNK